MINANELRIGNWVKLFNDDFYKIHVISKTVIQVEGGIIGGEVFKLEHTKPIPLTPEILEKCGFRMYCEKSIKTEWDNNPRFSYQYLCKNDRFIVTHTPSDDADRTFRAANDLIVKYLHQLQNLYFALTGEELTYTP